MKRPRQGFTLIELTLVTVIILALVSLSIPLFRKTFSSIAAKDTAFNIAKLASYARERAVIERKNFRLVLDFAGNSYQLFESNPSGDKITYNKIKGRFGRAFTLPQGLSFYDPQSDAVKKKGEEHGKQVTLYPDGHCDALVISIVDKSGAGCGIILKNSGAGVQVKEVANAK